MTFQSQLDSIAPGRPTAVTVGTFDGVHEGHRKLLAATAHHAAALGHGAAGAIVFRQQPRALLQPDRPVAYLSSLCSVAYTATQYALLSSFMAFARDVLSSSSGWAAQQMDWIGFFAATSVLALPGLVLLVWLMRNNRMKGAIP